MYGLTKLSYTMPTNLKVERTTDQKLIASVLSDPQFYEVALPDEEIAAIEDGRVDEIISTSHWLTLSDDKKLYGLTRVDYMTSVTSSVHGYLKPKYWGTSISAQFAPLVETWFRENTNIHKLVALSPKCCTHVLQSVARMGYEIEGLLVGAIYWRGKIEDLVILSKFIGK